VFEGNLQPGKAYMCCSVLQACCSIESVLQCLKASYNEVKHMCFAVCCKCVANVMQCCRCIVVFAGNLQPDTAQVCCSVCSVLQVCCSVASVLQCLKASYNQVQRICVAVCAVCCRRVAVLQVY